LGVGIDYDISPLTTVSIDLEYNQIDETFLGVPLDTVDGFGYTIVSVRELPNGTIEGSLTQNVNTDGTLRTLISAGRDIELPRGSLSFGLGYSSSERGEDAFIANLAASRDLLDGSMSARLEQRVAENDNNEDELITRLSLDFSHDINSVSNFGVNLGLGRSEDLSGADAGVTTRANVEVAYRRDLIADLDWSVGYRGRYIDEPGSSSRVSNSVFTRIGRSFSIRP
jgi:hypothetical protein